MFASKVRHPQTLPFATSSGATIALGAIGAAAQALKKERAEGMWLALEKIIPDVRKRTEVELVASPLTHEFWNRRFKGIEICGIPALLAPTPRSARAFLVSSPVSLQLRSHK